MEQALRKRLLAIVEEHERLSRKMSDPEVAANPTDYLKYVKAQREIAEVVACYRRYEREEERLADADRILREESDADLRALADEDKRELAIALPELEQALKLMLLPKDPNDEKNTIVEIRAGTGGEEAALFAADLFRMYSRYAELKRWKTEVMNSNPTGLGGFKEVCFKIAGENVYSQLKYEGGVHRVQRVPKTEAQGRIHTSTCTVAVLPEAEDVDVHVDPAEITIDVYRSSGRGGQHVNTTDSAVRITHLPTGVVVTCQDERSQHKNKAKAMAVLRAKLLSAKRSDEAEKRSADRRGQVGTGERSQRIRTYNFPQNRMTDHRIGLDLYKLDLLMEGEIQDVIDALVAAERAAQVAAVG
ncbi:MAG: peptide chain release factor 1 [Candidatus Hydrogenedentes bacterium]|nr:peptide chain release factor 1 [Candidatus Hydrogenedentota bacterium]